MAIENFRYVEGKDGVYWAAIPTRFPLNILSNTSPDFARAHFLFSFSKLKGSYISFRDIRCIFYGSSLLDNEEQQRAKLLQDVGSKVLSLSVSLLSARNSVTLQTHRSDVSFELADTTITNKFVKTQGISCVFVPKPTDLNTPSIVANVLRACVGWLQIQHGLPAVMTFMSDLSVDFSQMVVSMV